MNVSIPDLQIALKIDVDTKIGLREGVPRLASLLSELGIKASFFIVMGPDHSGRTFKRIFRYGFLRKQFNSGAINAYGPITLFYGTIFPGPLIGLSSTKIINQLLYEGHEVGIHGWDHVFWHDNMRFLKIEYLAEELDQASRLFRKITSMQPVSFASPGWQVTSMVYKLITRMGFTHVSCTRGYSPFRPLLEEGMSLPILELPTTMPTMDEALSLPGINSRNVGYWLSSLVYPSIFNVYTLHAEVEGRNLYPALRQFLILLIERGVIFFRLIDFASKVVNQKILTERIGWREIPNRSYKVASQLSFL